jgi:hypothetical protein
MQMQLLCKYVHFNSGEILLVSQLHVNYRYIGAYKAFLMIIHCLRYIHTYIDGLSKEYYKQYGH